MLGHDLHPGSGGVNACRPAKKFTVAAHKIAKWRKILEGWAMKMMRFLISLAICLLCLVSFAPRGLAQTSSTGALTVTVTDPSGAVVPGATVTVSNVAAFSRTQTTETNGSTTFTLLTPGNYQVSISAPKFTTIVVPSVSVNVAETHVLAQKLEVGSIAQQVTVTAEVQGVQTETSTLGGVVENLSLTSLPLVTRNYTEIMALSPGVTAGAVDAGALGRGFPSVYTDGLTNSGNNYLMDGVSVTLYGDSGPTGGAVFGEIPSPSPDALQEFKVQTSSYDAGYGRNAGANVDVVTKSGTNDWHGDLFEFFRNEDLNANTFFRNVGDEPRGLLRQNQFGGILGGPVLKQKLFFFISYEGTRQQNGLASQGSSNVLLPPQLTNDRTAAALGAAFCPANNPIASTETFSITGGNPASDQVACNGSNINPVALNILNAKLPNGTFFIPTPQRILSPGTAQEVGFSSFVDPATFSENQEIFNVDYVISPKNTLSEKFFYAYAPQLSNFDCTSCPPGTGGERSITGDTLESVKLTTVFSKNVVNEARFSIYSTKAVEITTEAVTPSSVGLTPPNAFLNLMPEILFLSPSFTFGTTFGLGDNNVKEKHWGWADQLSWTRGRHTMRAGFEGERVDWNSNVPGVARGLLVFGTFSDFLLGESSAQNGGLLGNIFESVASLQLPGPANTGVLNLARVDQASAFFQDDFRLSSTLTLNLGLRWEYVGTAYDSNPANGGDNPEFALDQLVPIPPASGTFAGWTVASNFNGAVPAGVLVRKSPLLSNATHAPLDDFEPRIGFAWQPLGSSGRFVVRGGYGWFRNTLLGNLYLLEMNNNPPSALTVNRAAFVDASATLQNPFNPTTVPSFAAYLRTPTSDVSQIGIDPNEYAPLTMAWNLNTQYELRPSLVLEVGYVGNRGIHLVTGTLLNIPQLATAASGVNCGAPIIPAAGPQNADGCILTNTAGNAAFRVPVMGLTPGGMELSSNVGDSDYNSLQVLLRKTFTHGLQFQAAYTWSKDLTDIAGTNFGGSFDGTVTSNDPADLAQQRGLADYNRAQRFVVNYTYQLPNYHQAQGILGGALSGWSVSGVTLIQSGNPLTITDSTGSGIIGSIGTARAEFCPGMTNANLETPGSVKSRLGDFFNLNAVADTSVTGASAAAKAACPYPIVGAIGGVGGATGFGNVRRGILAGPGQDNWDISINKRTRVGGLREDASLEFRTDFFNAFNHSQFANPSTAANSASFGQITALTTSPRVVQFALKYVF
jgi:Carboxypeptidase regulatory-like domain